jgi:hypothetical protein
VTHIIDSSEVSPLFQLTMDASGGVRQATMARCGNSEMGEETVEQSRLVDP